MNKFDERYDIRLAKISDVDQIMRFIDEYWKKGHIMSLDKELFMYEYADGDNINFVLAIDKNTHSIEGIFGFLRCSDTKDPLKKDIWGSIWKVVDTHDNMPFLGIELAKRVFSFTGCRTQIGNGANQNTTVPLRRLFFGDKVVKMKQYYLLNKSFEDYRVAIVKQKHDNKPNTTIQNEVTLREFKSIDEVKQYFDIESINAIPYKDNWYVNKRYFSHPYYKYLVYGIVNSKGQTGALMMARLLECNGNNLLRIVDYIGDQTLFSGLYNQFELLMSNYNLEYIDFFTYGFDEEAIIKAGFTLRTDQDPNVIPNYFEPFLRENVDIWAHYKYDGTLFFKADGDQDRPNIFIDKKIK
ncbi:hypothetical protein I5677_16420 [Mobilitalea sibirica]|uniref:Uncharacterized protein n=1 Tax=Mobilitalea sibirica TaxID=1462919 RepID=A0A8J7L3F6_9FIRM|nr:hypothetical protein [Mobilitalea sibirica]MBH1942488.1 hypothetical protein [Mobilitalea sibirica]